MYELLIIFCECVSAGDNGMFNSECGCCDSFMVRSGLYGAVCLWMLSSCGIMVCGSADRSRNDANVFRDGGVCSGWCLD